MSQNNSKKENDIIGDDTQLLSDYEDIINSGKLSRLNSSNPNQMLKKLSIPKFIGSYHLRSAPDQRFNIIGNLLRGKYDLNHAKSLKSIIFNPITIFFMILALGFNLLWLFSLLF